MSDIAWIKLYTGIFDGEKLKFIEAMVNRDTIECILIKLYIQAAKTNDKGLIYFNKKTPYTNEMFSIIFNRPLSAIESAFKVLSNFQMIEIYEDNLIRICNWEKYQNIEGMERNRSLNRNRVRDYRARKKENSAQDEVNVNDLNMETSENLVLNKTEKNNLNTQTNENLISNRIEESDLDLLNNSAETHTGEIFFAKNCNVTVMQQKENKIKNKNEIKKKNKNKNKSEIENKSDSDNEGMDNIQANETSNLSQSDIMDNDNLKSLSPIPEKQKIEKAANELLEHYKKNSVKVIGLNLNALKSCISIHGKDHARSAIDKSLEVNKPSMKYINGILKNWKREGYPALDNTESNYKAGSAKPLRFNNFKSRDYDYDSLEKALLGWDKDKS